MTTDQDLTVTHSGKFTFSIDRVIETEKETKIMGKIFAYAPGRNITFNFERDQKHETED